MLFEHLERLKTEEIVLNNMVTDGLTAGEARGDLARTSGQVGDVDVGSQASEPMGGVAISPTPTSLIPLDLSVPIQPSQASRGGAGIVSQPRPVPSARPGESTSESEWEDH